MIENVLISTGAQEITEIFLMTLLVFFVLGLLLKIVNKGHGFTQYVPTLLTTLGILGTFAGIISGLLLFDVTNIDDSISGLLAGLKTAFTTSLAGMFLSILYKLLVATGIFTPRQKDAIDEDAIGIADLYTVMKSQADASEAVRVAIGGDNESSLVGQMKLFRSDLNDQYKVTTRQLEPMLESLVKVSSSVIEQQQAFDQFQDRLWIKLQDFADMMSKSATEQVINALKEVIADFNNNLTEQFGENFKQLNEAVVALVSWQENYKLQLEQMNEQYKLGVQAITQTEAAVSHISEESKVIPANMEVLKSVMEVNQHQIQELERHLDAFKDIRDRAVEAVPEIRSQIDETVKGMKEASATITEGMAKTSEVLVSGLQSATELVKEEVSGSIKNMTSGITEATEEMKKAINEGNEEFIANSNRVNDALRESSDAIKENSVQTKDHLKDALEDINSILRNLIADLQQDSTKLNESYKQSTQLLLSETETLRRGFAEGMETMRKDLSIQLKELAELQSQESQRVLNGVSQHADQALRDTAEAVQKQVKALDDALAHELSVVMSEMGRALATITGKFTSDYQQLVEEMHKITQMRGGR